MRRPLHLALAAGLIALPVEAGACRLALVLAMDVSSSVDSSEDRLQRQGLAAALRDSGVQAAFLSGTGPVALHVFEWSGRDHQTDLIPDWLLIEGTDDLTALAQAIETAPRSRADGPTALGQALVHAADLLQRAPACDTAKIDVSGDGISNDGIDLATAHARRPLDGVTVNGLAIVTDEGGSDLVTHYREELIRGPGAFVEVAAGFADFERAMRRKLLAEVRAIVVGRAEVRPDPPQRSEG